jgi:hypothetical protein
MPVGSNEEDLNREILQKMRDGGDDLKTPRPVDFSHAFPDAASAASFAAELQAQGFQLTMEETGCVPDLLWDVVVTVEMAPSPDVVTATERDLGELASSLGGRADGWGCVRIVAD